MKNVQLYYDEMNSPVGPLLLISNGEKMVRIDFGTMAEQSERVVKWANRYFGMTKFLQKPEKVEHVRRELLAYFSKERENFTFDFEFFGTPFQKDVWQSLFDLIPYGETVSYKDIANAVGNPKAVRAVGGAVNKNPFCIVVPCHRVIGANGKMVGFGGGLDKKEYLLAHEGN